MVFSGSPVSEKNPDRKTSLQGDIFLRWPLLLFWGDSDASPHMLRKLRSGGSQGFTSALQVANLHLLGIAKGREPSLHSNPPTPGPSSTPLTAANKDMLSF